MNDQSSNTASSSKPGAWDWIASQLAMAFGIGRLPVSPGTFGSLPGLALGAGIYVGARLVYGDHDAVQIRILSFVALAVAFAVAAWSIHRTERLYNIHDDSRIVIDEVVGQAIACAFVAPSFWTLTIAFVLFRILDIWKPLAIGWIDEKAPGWWGTLCDDVLAGSVVALIFYLAL